jgi:hypothetical protein
MVAAGRFRVLPVQNHMAAAASVGLEVTIEETTGAGNANIRGRLYGKQLDQKGDC